MKIRRRLSLCKNGENSWFLCWGLTDSVRVMRWKTEPSCCWNVSIGLILFSIKTDKARGDHITSLLIQRVTWDKHCSLYSVAVKYYFYSRNLIFLKKRCNLIFLTNSKEMFWYLITDMTLLVAASLRQCTVVLGRSGELSATPHPPPPAPPPLTLLHSAN